MTRGFAVKEPRLRIPDYTAFYTKDMHSFRKDIGHSGKHLDMFASALVELVKYRFSHEKSLPSKIILDENDWLLGEAIGESANASSTEDREKRQYDNGHVSTEAFPALTNGGYEGTRVEDKAQGCQRLGEMTVLAKLIEASAMNGPSRYNDGHIRAESDSALIYGHQVEASQHEDKRRHVDSDPAVLNADWQEISQLDIGHLTNERSSVLVHDHDVEAGQPVKGPTLADEGLLVGSGSQEAAHQRGQEEATHPENGNVCIEAESAVTDGIHEESSQPDTGNTLVESGRASINGRHDPAQGDGKIQAVLEVGPAGSQPIHVSLALHIPASRRA